MTKRRKQRDSRMEADTDERLLEAIVEDVQVIQECVEELMPIAPYDESKLTQEQLTFIRDSQVPGRYVPREHSECASLRPAGYRFGVVVHTEKINEPGQTIIIRHCHCRFCRPWSQLGSKIDYRYKDIQTITH